MKIHVTDWSVSSVGEGGNHFFANPPGKVVAASFEKDHRGGSWLRLVTIEDVDLDPNEERAAEARQEWLGDREAAWK